MPRHRTLASILAAAFLLPLGALAADAASPPSSEPAQEVRKDDTKAVSKSADAKAHKKAVPSCDEATASRIRRNKAGECLPSTQPSRTYTKDDIESTGQTDMGEALKRLDPRFH